MPEPASIAVVIPTLNEADGISAALARLEGAGFAEVIVADGGSTDETVAIARAAGARLVEAPKGRGVQLEAGAQAAGCEALVFLHADTVLPDGAATHVRRALARPEVAGGCFRLSFDERGPLLDLYAWCSRFETGLTTFGDQAFFMRREAYDRAGGFPPWPVLEDVELRRRLRRGGRFIKLEAAIVTSARRYRAEGVLRRQLLNALVLGLFRLGVPPHQLTRLYRPHRPRSA